MTSVVFHTLTSFQPEQSFGPSAFDLAIRRIVDLLKVACVDMAPEGYKAKVVRAGLSQQDPVSARIGIYVHPNDPNDVSETMTWRDKPQEDEEELFSAIETGMCFRTVRKLIVDIDSYFVATKESRSQARQIANWLAAAVWDILQDSGTLAIKDQYGELVMMAIPWKIDHVEMGGPPNSFIWRNRVFVKLYSELAFLEQ